MFEIVFAKYVNEMQYSPTRIVEGTINLNQMNKKVYLLLTYVFALVFTYLFYRQSLGLNLLIFNLIVLTAYKIKLGNRFYNKPLIFIWIGTLITAMAVFVNGSFIAKFMNILSLFILNGFIVLPRLKNTLTSIIPSIENLITGPVEFVGAHAVFFEKSRFFQRLFYFTRIVVVPILIIGMFMSIYAFANSIFGEYLSDFFSLFNSVPEWIGDILSSGKFWMFLLGLIIAGMLFYHSNTLVTSNFNLNKSDVLNRVRKTVIYPRYFKMNGLKNEYKAGVFLFLILNSMILILNILDIVHVWWGFEWNDNYLREFVHEGTYLLIVSILISMFVTLYFFRKNLNFYTENGLLKKLAILWICQNVFLTLSVAMRNYWYVEYFALAYKRIGVFFFLMAVIAGLIFIILKIKDKKSTFYLVRHTSLASFIILITMSVFNWDSIIAKYNMAHYKSSFIHFNFLCQLSDRALPYLEKTGDELLEIKSAQSDKFRFKYNYMDVYTYDNIIQRRKSDFLYSFEKRHWLSKDLASYRAYNELSSE